MFSLDNTTESLSLTSVGGLTLIGETWNLTIDLFENASSSIHISYSNHLVLEYPNFEDWWEGPMQFSVDPGQSIVKQYVSHITADFVSGIGFFVRLNNSTGYAQGTYQLIMVFSGYLVDIGTSFLYISDIAAWRKEKNEELPRLVLTVAVLIVITSVSLILVQRRRQKRKKERKAVIQEEYLKIISDL